MRLRNQYSTGKTLLLSATPSIMSFMWDNKTSQTTILPNKDTHYRAIHDKKYLINITNTRPTVTPNTNTLVIKNSIKNSQRAFNDNFSKLLHSKFPSERKSDDLVFLIDKYGKHSGNNNHKPNIMGTHIIQAALDVSFTNITEDVLSPEGTIQRIGRCNRWGESDKQPNITIYKPLPGNIEYKANQKIKEILYSVNLSDVWFDSIQQYDGKEVSLNELYVLYNTHTNHNQVAIKNYIKQMFSFGLQECARIYPIKYKQKKRDESIIKAGSNKLRTMHGDNEIFFIVRDVDNGVWSGPFNEIIRTSFNERFRENGETLKNMLSSMKVLRNNNDTRFEFNEILDVKSISLDVIREKAKFNNTPYFNYVDVYDSKLGLINREFRNTLN
jgi:hypothetical protein